MEILIYLAGCVVAWWFTRKAHIRRYKQITPEDEVIYVMTSLFSWAAFVSIIITDLYYQLRK